MPLSWPLQQSYQDLIRLRHIAETLMRHGLGFIIERLGLSSLLPLRRRRALTTDDQAIERLSPAVRVRRALEELGPTYIKLGQLLSTRPDLLPAEVITELSKLLDDVPPFPADIAIRRIETELGRPLEELFAQFEPTPIAAASIGQVHRAQLHSGERVVIKVRRPGIEQTIESDLALLLRQARFLEAHSSLLHEYQIVDILEEFGQSLRDELNYVREGHNADRLRRVLEHKRVQIPTIYWDMTTQRVIVMQDIEGAKLSELLATGGEGHDLPAIARMIADAYLEQVFIAGFFHADPHPANILIQDGRMGLVDFGLTGFLSEAVKESFGDLFVALMTQDVERVGDLILRIGAASVSVNRQSLERDIQRLLQRYYGLPLEHIQLGQSLEEVMQVAFRHHIRLPSDLALLARMLIILEGITRQLDPQFNFVQFAKPFMSRMIGERLSLRHLRDEASSILREYSELARALPRYSMDLMQRLQQGEATVRIEVNRLEQLMRRADKISNRLAFSVVTAALIIGSALMIQAGAESSVWQLPVLGWGIPIARLVFVIAGILGAWLLFSIVRARGL